MVTTITQKGQTVVPAAIRHRFNLQSNTKLEWMTNGRTIRVIPIPADPIHGARGIAKGAGLMKALMEDRKQERNRGGK
jgi:AbrB family looped-hinge helix DNA binding protein